MSSFLAKLWARLSPRRVPLTVMIIGLDNSGKTSILKSLSSPSVACRVSPTTRAAATATTPPSRSRPQSPNDAFGDDDEFGIEGQLQSDIKHNDYDSDGPMIPFGGSPSESKCAKEGYGGQTSKLDDLGRSNIRLFSSNDNQTGGDNEPTIGYNFQRIQFKTLSLTVLDFSGQTKYRSLWQEFYNSVDGIVFVIDSSDLIRLVVARDELENLLGHPYFATLNPAINETAQQRQPVTPIGQQPFSRDAAALQMALAQKQLTISQGKLVQTPLNQTTTATSAAPSSQAQQPKQQQQTTVVGRKRTKVPILFLANKAELATAAKTELIVKALNLNQLPPERHPWFVQATSVLNSNQGIVEAFEWLTNQLSLAATTTTAPATH